ncbi:MAG: LytTR family DNA-binding domain-containing protein [Taibaiella sp.]|nr:LytTR family DNA-binding domain-containing protein [Taibaiella sp.]
MKVVVIEDEKISRLQLVKYICQFDKTVEIVAELDSIGATIDFFSTKKDIDLVISDIELRDGNILSAWKELNIKTSVIFVTAYDKFWLDAFRNSGIGYILKPFTYEDIEHSLLKFLQLKEQLTAPAELSLQRLVNYIGKSYKQRITYKLNDKIYVLVISSVVYFTIHKGVVYAVDKACKKHPLQYTTLQELEHDLDPGLFFKINRSDIVQIQYIHQMKSIEGERTEVYLQGLPEPLYTSTNRNAAFKKWFENH